MVSEEIYNVRTIPSLTDWVKIKKKYPELVKEETYFLFKEFAEFLMEEVVNCRKGINLPMHLGTLMMGAFPSKNNIFKDKRRYCEQKYGIDHFSIQERDGFECRVLYTTSRTRKFFKASTFFGFKPKPVFTAKATAAL